MPERRELILRLESVREAAVDSLRACRSAIALLGEEHAASVERTLAAALDLRSSFLGQISDEIARLGGDARREGAEPTEPTDAPAFADCVTSERSAKRRFVQAMEDGLPAAMHGLVTRQAADCSRTLRTLEALVRGGLCEPG